MDTDETQAKRGTALAVAEIETDKYRSRESVHLLLQTSVDWALFLVVPGLVIGVSAGWGILWPTVICSGSGAILGLLYGLRMNGIRDRGAERLDFAWNEQRKKDELTKMLRNRPELRAARPLFVEVPRPEGQDTGLANSV